MKEEDIRSKQWIREKNRLDVQDANKMMRRKKEFIKVSCPACESKKYKVLFKKQGFEFVICQNCETVFISPRPTSEILAEYYESSRSIKYWNDKIFPLSEKSRRKHIFIPRAKRVVDLCNKYKVATRVLFDVGAGFGTFCEEIKKLKAFNKVIAIEPSHGFADTCRHKGLEVIENTIEKVKIDKASVITNFELIEHLFWPKDFLLACHRALLRGGLLFLTTPNIEGFDLLVLGKLSDNICGPNHVNYFNPKSLSYLLSKCGFKAVEVMTPGELDAELVRKKALSGQFDISKHPFLKQILIDQWESAGEEFQHFLADNKLSSHLWIVARKI